MKPFRIIVVDDDPIFGKIIHRILQDLDHEIKILQAGNAAEALEMLKTETPHLIITDWDMPGISGIEFCRKIHANPDFEDIPVIMCTGINTSSENLKTAFEAGVVDFIRKPIDKMELLSRVNSMLKLTESYKTIKNQKEEILNEKQKTEKLLKAILPKKIANELKEFGRTEPELYEDVTVLYSDIVDFTEKSSKIEPLTLIKELNEIVQGFDEIMEQNDCERIKTVGDAYIAVCGMPVPNKNHAVNIIQAALDTLDFLSERNKISEHQWTVRIGIDTGKIIGGIIGAKKYIYDIFGNPINTASRLEHSSMPMRIHVSERTFKLANGKFNFEEQQAMKVKGIGLMKMYFVK